MTSLLILGAGRQGRNALEVARACQTTVAGFLDDTRPTGSDVEGVPVLGGFADAARHLDSGTKAFVAVGENRARQRVSDELLRQGVSFASLVHPTAVVLPEVCPGSFIGAFVHVRGGVSLARGVLIESQTAIGRDVRFEAYASTGLGVMLTPDAVVGTGAFLGSGSTIVNRVTIGAHAVVGAGATVLDDVPDGAFVVGTPARVTTRRSRNFPQSAGGDVTG